MKKILILLLLTTTMFSQNKVTVNGITLSYDRVQKVMTLNIIPKSVYTNDMGISTNIEIHKQFVLKIVVGGITYSMSEPYFQQKGYVKDMGWNFSTTTPSGCKEIKPNYLYQFTNITPGEEYILEVSKICDGKYIIDNKSKSLIIN